MPEKEIVNKMSAEEELNSDGNVSRTSSNPSPSPEIEKGLELPKHPLQSDWTLWYFKNDRTKDWTQNQKKVFSNNYFWGFF